MKNYWRILGVYEVAKAIAVTLFTALYVSNLSGIEPDPCPDLEGPVYTYDRVGTRIAQTFTVEESGLLGSLWIHYPCENDVDYVAAPGRLTIRETMDGKPDGPVLQVANWEPDGPNPGSLRELYFNEQFLEGGRQYAVVLEVFDILPPWGIRFGLSTEDIEPGGQVWVASPGGGWEAITAEDAGDAGVDLIIEKSIFAGQLPQRIISPTNGGFVSVGEPFKVTVVTDPAFGSDVRVEFNLEGGEIIGTATETPFEIEWTAMEIGFLRIYSRLFVEGQERAVIHVDVTARLEISNDDFANPTFIEGSFVETMANNEGATREFGEVRFGSNQGGHSIWYEWTPPFDGVCTIEGNGPGAGYLLYTAYSGDEIETAVTIASNGPDEHPLVFDAFSDLTYRISIDSYFDDEFGELNWSLKLAPENDDFLRRRDFSSEQLNLFGTTSGATRETDEPGPAEGSRSLWYVWRASVDGEAVVTIESPEIAPWVAIRAGSSMAQLAEVVVSNTEVQDSKEVRFYASSGVPYLIQVMSLNGVEGAFVLGVRQDTLKLLSPADGATVRVGSMVEFSSVPNLPSGDIASVAYFVDGVKVGEANEPPYAFFSREIEPGNHRVHAESRSSGGVVSRSPSRTVFVFEGSSLPQPRVFVGNQRYPEAYVIDAAGTVYHWGGFNWRDLAVISQERYYRHFVPQVVSLPFPSDEIRGIEWRDDDAWFLLDDGSLYVLPGLEVEIEYVNEFGNVALRKRTPEELEFTFEDGIVEFEDLTTVSRPQDTGDTGSADVRWVDVWGVGDDIYALNAENELWMRARRGVFVQVALAQGMPPIRPRVTWESTGGLVTLHEDGHAYVHHESSSGSSQYLSTKLDTGMEVQWKFAGLSGGLAYALADDGRLFYFNPESGTLAGQVNRPPGVNGWSRVAFASGHVLGIADDGRMFAWGHAAEGRLGNGSTFDQVVSRPLPVTVPDGVDGWMAVAASGEISLAIGDDCRLYSWGLNTSGALGAGVIGRRSIPKPVYAIDSLCGVPMIFTDGERSRLPDGRFMIEFRSDLNRSYTIQYSDDGKSWLNSVPTILGNGSLLQWIDEGPPVTHSAPSENVVRMYRIVLTP